MAGGGRQRSNGANFRRGQDLSRQRTGCQRIRDEGRTADRLNRVRPVLWTPLDRKRRRTADIHRQKQRRTTPRPKTSRNCSYLPNRPELGAEPGRRKGRREPGREAGACEAALEKRPSRPAK